MVSKHPQCHFDWAVCFSGHCGLDLDWLLNHPFVTGLCIVRKLIKMFGWVTSSEEPRAASPPAPFHELPALIHFLGVRMGLKIVWA